MEKIIKDLIKLILKAIALLFILELLFTILHKDF